MGRMPERHPCCPLVSSLHLHLLSQHVSVWSSILSRHLHFDSTTLSLRLRPVNHALSQSFQRLRNLGRCQSSPPISLSVLVLVLAYAEPTLANLVIQQMRDMLVDIRVLVRIYESALVDGLQFSLDNVADLCLRGEGDAFPWRWGGV